MLRLSTTRLPADHFLSGALFGGMTAAALEINKDDDLNTKVKKVAKFAIISGTATSLSISASNKLVAKNYFGAAFDVALGVGLIIATQSLIENKNTKNKA